MEENIPVAIHADGSTSDSDLESNSTDDEALVAPPVRKICDKMCVRARWLCGCHYLRDCPDNQAAQQGDKA